MFPINIEVVVVMDTEVVDTDFVYTEVDTKLVAVMALDNRVEAMVVMDTKVMDTEAVDTEVDT